MAETKRKDYIDGNFSNGSPGTTQCCSVAKRFVLQVMSPTQPLAEAQESMTPDQRLDLLLAEHEQKHREDAAAAALARIRRGDHSGVHASREGVHPQSVIPNQQQNQCRPNGQASSSSGYAMNQCHPNGQASSSFVHAMTQCRPSGQAGQTVVANFAFGQPAR